MSGVEVEEEFLSNITVSEISILGALSATIKDLLF
jgi:hypothetical protein